jgi:hypothetical protein
MVTTEKHQGAAPATRRGSSFYCGSSPPSSMREYASIT